MNWGKAKNISILVFLMLNIGLMTLIHIDNRRFVLASDNQAAIVQVLADNGVYLSDNFSFVRHSPLRRMNLAENNLSNRALVSLFMRNNTGLYVENTPYGDIFSTNVERVSFYNGSVKYENIYLDISFLNETEMRSFSNSIIRGLGDSGRYFSFDNIKTHDDTTILSYRQIYRNNIIYSNYIIFTFVNNNLQTIHFNLNPVTGFFGENRSLRSSDEILLTFMRKLDREPGQTITIDSMDIVYRATDLIASPYYRIIFNCNQTMLINAYTGLMGR